MNKSYLNALFWRWFMNAVITVLLKKILSKRAQISMEIGILVAVAVAVAAIAAFYYTTSVRDAAKNAGNAATTVTSRLSTAANNFAKKIPIR